MAIRMTADELVRYYKRRGKKIPEIQGGGTPSPILPYWMEQQEPEEKKSKYNNKKIEIDGIVFDSEKEAKYYYDLKRLKAAREIKDYQVKPEKFILQPGYRDREGKWIRPITYTADFKIIHLDGSVEYVDTKGMRTEVFNIKLKIFNYKYPDLILKLI